MARRGVSLNNMPTGLAGRIGMTLFFSVFFLAGLAFFVFMIGAVAAGAAVNFWPTAECAIVRSEVRESGEDDETSDPYVLDLAYRYTVDGQTYTGTELNRRGNGSDDVAGLHRIAQAYPPRSTAECRVNPSDPTEAYLRADGVEWMIVPFLAIPLIFMLVGGGMIYAVWRSPSTEEEKKKQSISSKDADGGSGWAAIVPILFFGVFFCVGAGVVVGLLVLPALRAFDARDWREVPCTILSSEVRSHSDSDGTTYSVDIHYRYAVDDSRYESNRYSFFSTGSSSGYDGKREIVERYPEGSERTCFVDPDDPREAALTTAFTRGALWGLFGLPFLAVGGGGLYWVGRNWMRGEPAGFGDIGRKRKRSGRSISSADRTPDADALPRAAGSPRASARGGPHELKGPSRLGKFLAVLIAGVFWNGIVSIFAWQVASGWLDGDPDYFLSIFLIPFLLVGIGLLGGAVYHFLAIFNPAPHLTIDSRSAVVGESLTLDWTIKGKVEKIRLFSIKLEGRESATYRRGTNTCTDTETFAEHLLFETQDPGEMRKGRVPVEIPFNTMHTFDGGNNEIEWKLKVSGDIPRWPDVGDEFAIEVLPIQPPEETA